MSSNASNVTTSDASGAVHDLGPLAWVLDELRKSLDGSSKALKRFVRDAEAARGSDLAAVDASQLRIARQQLHQAVGALEMVGLTGPSLVLRAMEIAVQKFVQQPEQCNQEAASKIERASFALTEYLEALLANKQISPVSLFPQYREVQELVRTDRIHPADLWPCQWRWQEPQFSNPVAPRNYDESTRVLFDQSVLQLMKGAAPLAAKEMRLLSLGLSARQIDTHPRIFWIVAAAFFEALEHSAIVVDLYVRRAASRILIQYSALSKGDTGVSERLAQDLLFFCAQAGLVVDANMPVLKAVQSAFGLSRFRTIDYEAIKFGRFDPALLAQVRKRISSAKETWSALAAGDANKFKTVVDQFSLVADSLVKLHPPSEPLAQALTSAIEVTARSNKAPALELAMEVATSVLYLEAAFEDLDPNDPQLANRTRHLADRLDSVKNGGIAQPLEPWMEELYRHVSDKQTMGSVVGELRISLGELEKSLDAFFRNPKDKLVLRDVPGQLAQMRGVLSVLGLDQASQAVLRMRGSVESMLETEVDEELARGAGTFDQLGNNLGALSFLIDMLNYQPVLAKKLFVYDDIKGELRPVMGRTENSVEKLDDEPVSLPLLSLPQAVSNITSDAKAGASSSELTIQLDALATHAALAGQPDLAKSAQQASAAVVSSNADEAMLAMSALAATVAMATAPMPVAKPIEENFEEDDLQDIFLEEAREVAQNGAEALRLLDASPSDVSQLTILRRAFHTLKGSARMVGLNEFGEAAWSMEQVFNNYLAEQRPATSELLDLSSSALAGLSQWVEAISTGNDSTWRAEPFLTSADAFRLNGRLVPLALVAANTAKKLSLDTLEFELPSLDLPFAESIVITSPDAEPLDTNRSHGQPAEAVVSDIDFTKVALLVGQQLTSAPDLTFDLPEMYTAFAPENSAELSDSEIQELFKGSQPVAAEPVVSASFATLDEPQPIDIQGIDLDSLAALSGTAALNAATFGDVERQPLINDSSSLLAARMDQANDADSSPNANTDSDPDLDMDMDMDMEALQKQLDAFALESAADFPTSPDIDFDLAFDEPAVIGEGAANDLAESAQLVAIDSGSAVAPFLAQIDRPFEESAIGLSIAENSDEQVKIIGNLRIGLALFNVYLNEADEWSRRLATEVAEWALEKTLPPTDSMVALAHSLAGSSATVGFNSLSEIARELEHRLEQSQAHYDPIASEQYSYLFVQAADDIRRLLHQFAAGFLKEANVEVLVKLQQLEFSDVSSVNSVGLEDFEDHQQQSADNEALSTSSRSGSELLLNRFEGSIAALDSALAPAVLGAVPAADTLAVVPALVARSELLATSAVPTAFLASASGNASSEGGDDELDAVDAIDPELFPIFDEEAAELMPQLGSALRQWAARPDNAGARLEVLRVLHTLKGSARLSGAMRLGEVAHNIETEIEFLGTDGSASQNIEPLLARFDMMELMLDKLRHPSAVVPDEPATPAAVVAVATPDVDAAQPIIEVEENTALFVPAAGTPKARGLVPAPQLMAMQPLRQAANASIRVRSQLLDRMVNQAGEVMITRSRLEVELNQLRGSLGDMNDNLNRLRHHLRDIELQAETQMQSRLAQAKEQQGGFDPLEFDRFTRVQELTRMMAESVNDVATVQRTLQRTVEATEDDLIAQARQTRELQRDLLRTRMVEFESISDRLYRVVRLASKETGKQVKLDLLGGTIEMDRGMLNRMTPAFEHLLRNCVGHGIESPQERLAAGKDTIGVITVHLRQEGNDVSVEFSDDGAGLDLARIREKAISSGLMSVDQLMDDKQAADLIFMPGFSTASQVTELSGRGIGMDVVRSEVNGIGGRIETSTARGKGSRFKLVLPLTTAVTQVVMIRAGKLTVGVPANVVETVRRVTSKELEQAYNSGVLEVAGEQTPFFWSGALLQSSSHTIQVQAKTSLVIVFKSAAQRIALHVDEVLGNQEVVVKNLGPQLARLPGLAGMSVLPSGAVVLIYNPVALATVYGDQARVLSADRAEAHMLEASANESGVPISPAALVPVAAQVPLIMVVDDSITVRRVTQRMLLREGYRVVLASDGLQALEKLADELPTVVLSDIEMPRMDGFDLARNIRGDARLKGLPIIMITSRIAEKHRDHAKELGVDHYLGKPYSEDELIGLVRYYCGLEVTA